MFERRRNKTIKGILAGIGVMTLFLAFDVLMGDLQPWNFGWGSEATIMKIAYAAFPIGVLMALASQFSLKKKD